MKIFKSMTDWKQWRQALDPKDSLGFVPTMGALHAGHISLCERSKSECDFTAVSIYVNPTQFNDPSDFQKYPVTVDRDIELLRLANVDALILPSYQDLYPDQYSVRVIENPDQTILCGAHRPGHFEGVLTVVLKLLNLVRPSHLFLGEKDYQQLHLIRKMVSALLLNVEVVGVPTVRESDGLAMSSRNVRLSPAAREKAPLIFKNIKSNLSAKEIVASLSKAGFEVEYVEQHWGRRFIAAKLENVRLIDNVQL